MKIVLAQYWTSNIPYTQYTKQINQKYCEENNYIYHVECNDIKIKQAVKDRAFTWYKPLFLLDVLIKHNPDYVLFLDADAVVTNHKERIETFISEEVEIVMTEDYGPSLVNAGVMLLKNSAFVKTFLQDWWDVCEDHPQYKQGLWHDQTCLKFVYDGLENKNKFEIIDNRILNSSNHNNHSFVFHAFSYGHQPYRTLDQVYKYIFNMNPEELTLSQISKKYPTDKEFSHNYYNAVYEEPFSKIKNEAKKVCEIGIGGFNEGLGWVPGNSLKVWRDYFPNAQILGLDIVKHELTNNERITVDWLDQSKLDLVKEYSSKLSNYDIILDDGSHNTYDQIITFAYFFRSLRSGGIYVLEDLHTSIEVKMPEKVQIWGWGDPNRSNPLETLETFQATGEVVNDYLTDRESQYLKDNIASVEIFKLAPTSITSIIRKK